MDDKLQNQINNLPKKATYTKEIRQGKLNSYVSKRNINSEQDTGQTLKEKYDKLLHGKVNDPNIKKILIEKSDQLIKNRISMWVAVKDLKKGIAGSFTVNGIVPEDEEFLYNMLIGIEIGSNDWNPLLSKIETDLKSAGRPVAGVYNDIVPPERMHVDEVFIETSFN